MKIAAIVIASLVAVPAMAGGPAFLDLTSPGALERLQQERPKHYAAVMEVLRVAQSVHCQEPALQTLKARYDVSKVDCQFLVMTSFPAKRRVSFEVEGAPYVALVTLDEAGGTMMPALVSATSRPR